MLSADGETMTVVSTDYHADGTTYRRPILRARVSGGPGLAGKWKEVKVNRPSDTMIISVPSAGQIKYEIPRQKEILQGAVDGTPSSVQGPSVPEGATIAFKQLTPNKVEWSYTVKSTVLQKGVDSVSSDGKSLSSVSWAPGKESEKTSEVYGQAVVGFTGHSQQRRRSESPMYRSVKVLACAHYLQEIRR